MIAELQQLWQEAFGDSQEDIAEFFATGFSPQRVHCIWEDGKPVSALHWFDSRLADKKIAYLYAVATARAHRGKGLARRLMDETRTILTEKGYAGMILVPMQESLFGFYKKLGFTPATTINEFICDAGPYPAPLTRIDAEQYARLRKTYLSANSVLQEKEVFAYLQTYAQFYMGTDFLLTATAEGDLLTVHEFLGNTQAAPNILNTLGLPRGKFRAPGNGRAFSVFFPLQSNCPAPDYFGLAMD